MDKPAELIHVPPPPLSFTGAYILTGARAAPGSDRLPPDLASYSRIWPPIVGSAPQFLDLATTATTRRRSSLHEGGDRRRGHHCRARAWM
jgi:hypothetical protein